MAADPAAGVGVFAALAAGLVSFLSPCVLPLVPAYVGQLAAIAVASAADGAPPSRWTAFRHGLAFVGVDIQDDRDAAEEFLAELPVPYPSIYDQDAEAVFSLGWTQVSPTTWFIDERGEIVHQRPGAYPDRAALEADIQNFLLSG